MDKATSDLFLVHQKETEEEIQKLTNDLSRMGKVLAQGNEQPRKSPFFQCARRARRDSAGAAGRTDFYLG
jgi:hypothetical protein